MPTGYTAKIKEGMTFEEFALYTATAFGALAHLRDVSNPTIEQILAEPPKVSSYHEDRLPEAEKELEELYSTSFEELQRQWETSRKARIDGCLEDIQKRNELKKKYESMLEKVERYVAPSPDHEGHKKFMKDQIIDSIKFDCEGNFSERYMAEIEAEAFDDWYEAKIETLKSIIKNCKESLEKEKETNKNRHQWIQQLAKAVRDVT